MKKVHVEFQRVQSWLFSVPRLRAMVGANTLLGEVLRVELPKLARQTGKWTLASITSDYPGADRADPLATHDDPALDARDGILARDGGHFEAAFSAGADGFAQAVIDLLSRELPGLRFRVSTDGQEVRQATAELSTELPVLARCEWTGRGLASAPVQQGNDVADVTVEVARRHQAARRAETGKAVDLASLLIACTGLKEMERPETFERLTGNGYMAVLHADGNDVGRGVKESAEHPAKIFHRNRVLLRRALKFAIDRTGEKATTAPLLPLMLGGDDLLVVSRADAVLPFAVDLCEELQRLQRDSDGSFHLTLGVGVVFAKPTIPFHRLHEVGEKLAASAKRLYRALRPKERVSVVDWAVYTASWVADPEEIRRRDWVRGMGENARVLSLRPMPVSGENLTSLKGLLRSAKRLDEAPRSQLRYLVDQLPRGKSLSQLAFAELSPKAKSVLEDAGITELWRSEGPGLPDSTSVLDLVELFEIGNLGRAGVQKEKTNARV